MNEDYRANRRWLVKQCSCVEYLLAKDVREGSLALAKLLSALQAYEAFFDARTKRGLQRLQALRAALPSLPAGRIAERTGHETVLVMWDAMHSVDQTMRAQSRGGKALLPRQLYEFRYVVAGLLVVSAMLFFTADWMRRDAASAVAFNFMQSFPEDVVVTGIHSVEHDAVATWRWVEGPRACIEIDMPMARRAMLRFVAINPIEQQGITIFLNDSTVASMDALPAKPWGEEAVRLDKTVSLRRGKNALCFQSRDFNHNKTAFAPNDPSRYAFAVTELSLTVLLNALQTQ